MWLGFEPKQDGSVITVDTVSSELASNNMIRAGDVLVSVNGKPAKNMYDLNKSMIDFEKGQTVDVVVRHGNGQKHLQLALSDVPKPSGPELAKQLLGLEFGTPSGGLGVAAIYPVGMSLKNVIEKSPAALAGLRPGLLISRINDHEITTLDDVALALEDVKDGDAVTLTVISVFEKEAFIVAQTSSIQLRAY